MDKENGHPIARQEVAERAEGRRTADHLSVAVFRMLTAKNILTMFSLASTIAILLGGIFTAFGGQLLWPSDNMTQQLRSVNARVDTLTKRIDALASLQATREEQLNLITRHVVGLTFFRCNDPTVSPRELRLSGLPCDQVLNVR